MTKATRGVPEGFHAVIPSLTFDDAVEAIDWCKKAPGAKETERATGPDGKILHAELQIGNSRIMLNDAMMGPRARSRWGARPSRSTCTWQAAPRRMARSPRIPRSSASAGTR